MTQANLDVMICLIEKMDTASIRLLLQHLKRTRRRTFTFCLNTNIAVTTRAIALDYVRREYEKRSDNGRMPANDPLGLYVIAPIDGRNGVIA